MATRYPVYGGVADYNPQDWRQNAPAPGSFRSHADIRPQVVLTADLTTGPIPSPPPPYSPSDSPSAANPSSLNAIAAARHTASPANAAMFGTPVSAVSTNSPFSPLRLRQGSLSGAANAAPPANNAVPTFAPPPNSTRDRSSSRTRDAQRGLFGLSALRNRSTDRLGSSAAPANTIPQSAHPSIPRAANTMQYAPHQYVLPEILPTLDAILMIIQAIWRFHAEPHDHTSSATIPRNDCSGSPKICLCRRCTIGPV